MPPRIGPKKPVRVFLKEWRKAEGLTLEQLGARFDPELDKGTISRWESVRTTTAGKLTVGVIAAYAEALGRPVTDMYRPPGDWPSLDAMAAKMPDDIREQAVNVVSALAKQKAS